MIQHYHYHPPWNDSLSTTYFFVLGSLVATETPRILYYHPITVDWLSLVVIYPQGMIPYQPNNNEVMALREKSHLVGSQLCITQQNSHFYLGQDLLTCKQLGTNGRYTGDFMFMGLKC